MTTKFDYCLAELCKTAEEVVPPQVPPEKPKNKYVEVGKIIGGGLLGLGTGYAAGALAGKGLEHFVGRAGGNAADVARKAIPIAGGAAGIIYPIWQSHQQKAIQDAVESAHNQSDERVSGQ